MDSDVEDAVLGDAIGLFGNTVVEDDTIYYGPLALTTAPKEGKANNLMADHLFSPSLLLAERIERGLLPVSGKTVLELGAGCALPTLLAATLPAPPSLVVTTDYPDELILGNLRRNVERNRAHFTRAEAVRWVGYEWGTDVSGLLDLAKDAERGAGDTTTTGFDVVVLSDLLHFHASHDVLLSSLTSLLARRASARAYVAAGKYTRPEVCAHFMEKGTRAGLAWEEVDEDAVWRGTMAVRGGGGGLDGGAQLGVRKGMCRAWVGRWAEDALLYSDAI